MKTTNTIVPLVKYLNAELHKDQILEENKGKTGIYRWVNKVNNKEYIGSAIDLRTRFYVYYSIKRLNNSNMIIYKALLKHGYSNFSLEILEYCSSSELLEKENYYITTLKPEYNILQEARSSLGYKHSEEALAKMSAVRKNLSEEARQTFL